MDRLRTILVVESDSSIRRLIRDKLPQHLPGYEVIEVQNEIEALCLAQERDGAIDIIVADSVAGGMTTAFMSDSLRIKCPRVKFIYMSGCFEDSESGRNGTAQTDVLFLAKPFSMQVLSEAVRRLEDPEQS